MHRNVAGNVFVVWQDNVSGTVKFRSGTFSTTATEDYQISDRCHVFPNPASTAWHVQGSFPHPDLRIELLDLNGRTLQHINESQGNTLVCEIPNAFLSSGVYLIRISDGITQEVFKVVKE